MTVCDGVGGLGKKGGLLLSLYLFNKLFVVAHNTKALSLTCLYLNLITAQSSSISSRQPVFQCHVFCVAHVAQQA